MTIRLLISSSLPRSRGLTLDAFSKIKRICKDRLAEIWVLRRDWAAMAMNESEFARHGQTRNAKKARILFNSDTVGSQIYFEANTYIRLEAYIPKTACPLAAAI